MSDNTFRIYVACLAAYNNGIHHGKWIDVGDDINALQAEIDDILRTSPYPNVTRLKAKCNCCEGTWIQTTHDHNALVCPECDEKWNNEIEDNEIEVIEGFRSSEEYAIHDYEGISGLSEHESLEALVKIADLLEEHGDAFRAIFSYHSDVERCESLLTDGYLGEFEKVEDYAYDLVNDCGMLDGMPENLRYYFDYESFARDMDLNGDINAIEHEGMFYIFDGHL